MGPSSHSFLDCIEKAEGNVFTNVKCVHHKTRVETRALWFFQTPPRLSTNHSVFYGTCNGATVTSTQALDEKHLELVLDGLAKHSLSFVPRHVKSFRLTLL